MRAFTVCLMAFLLLPLVEGIDFCGATNAMKVCRLVTPELNCTSYNYSIYHMNGSIIQSGNLTNYLGDYYYVDLNLSKGGWVVEICSNQTAGIQVEDVQDNMIIAAIILAPLILAIILALGAATMSQEHGTLKVFLFLLSVPLFFTSLHYGTISVIEYFDITALQDAIGTTTYWVGVVFGVIITYFIINLLIKMIEYIAKRKEAKLKY